MDMCTESMNNNTYDEINQDKDKESWGSQVLFHASQSKNNKSSNVFNNADLLDNNRYSSLVANGKITVCDSTDTVKKNELIDYLSSSNDENAINYIYYNNNKL